MFESEIPRPSIQAAKSVPLGRANHHKRPTRFRERQYSSLFIFYYTILGNNDPHRWSTWRRGGTYGRTEVSLGGKSARRAVSAIVQFPIAPGRSPNALVPNVFSIPNDFVPLASIGCWSGAKCFVPVKYRRVLGCVQQSFAGFFAMSLQSYSPRRAVVLHQV